MNLCEPMDECIHITRLKNRLLFAVPGLTSYTKGRDILLTFEEDVGDALKKACDHDSDAMHLMRAAQSVCVEMFESKYSFTGSFDPEFQTKAVPPTLLALISMILDGASIKDQTHLSPTNAA